MGKITSVVQFNGHVGNLVGITGQDGEFYLRRYRDHINNPNTIGQITTRTKFALAGNLAKLIPSDIIYGMTGSGRRGRRQRWVKVMMRQITTTISDGKVSAILAPKDLILSEGSPFFDMSVSNVAIAEGNLSMSVELPESDAKSLMVAVYADGRDGSFSAVDSKVAEETGTLTMPLPHDTFQVVNLYAIPIVAKSDLANVRYDNIVDADGETISCYSSDAIFYNSTNYSWRRSQFIGSYSAQ